MSAPVAHVRPAEYRVSVFPDDMANSADPAVAEAADVWSLTVAWRGRDQWAVMRGPWCLNDAGELDTEPIPSERDEDWLASHRFRLHAALALAIRHAPHVTVNGKTAAEILAGHQQRGAA